MEAPYAPVEALKSAPLSEFERRIVEELVKAYPAAVPSTALVNALYWDNPNGGALDARNVISIYAGRVRKKLSAFGWTVPRCGGGQGAQGRYRLVPIDRERAA